MWEISVLSAQFCSEYKTALNNEVLKEKTPHSTWKTKQQFRNEVRIY